MPRSARIHGLTVNGTVGPRREQSLISNRRRCSPAFAPPGAPPERSGIARRLRKLPKQLSGLGWMTGFESAGSRATT